MVDLRSIDELFSTCKRLKVLYEEDLILSKNAMGGQILDEYRTLVKSEMDIVASVESKINNLVS